MPVIVVEARIAELDARLRDVAKRQLPFAIAASLTKVAELSRDRVRAEMHGRFTIRSKRVIRGITINSARKSDFPNPVAVVGTLDAFMARQFLGGTKKPEKGARTVAVPAKHVEQRRTKSGRIPKRLKPRQVRDRKGARRTGRFILVSRGGRRSRAATGVFYSLVRSAKIPQRMDFVRTVEIEVGQSFERVFERRLRKAILEAR